MAKNPNSIAKGWVNKALKDDEIQRIKQEIINDYEVIKKEYSKVKNETNDFLEKINELLKMCLKDGLTFAQMKRIIYDKFSFNVSAQVIKKYAVDYLGYIHKEKEKSTTHDSNNHDRHHELRSHKSHDNDRP
ncbi:hypothetical protein [Helicobacter cetorum]|uniref:Uncharacterized protein n=1 Tax=Helicobacter cetorum (strain ATCC BAA-540 / CCUG 52418 / MIT 99-5656) TaxID=1163745 RepID=I0EUV2_HELCM|nr:hypothetical protein [Helicobacter cetorum]AFI06721.1 hypothetical protein HCD_08794 [Helicobacter cetorum MIT 99-5656]